MVRDGGFGAPMRTHPLSYRITLHDALVLKNLYVLTVKAARLSHGIHWYLPWLRFYKQIADLPLKRSYYPTLK